MTYSRVDYEVNVGCNGLKGPANQEAFDCGGKMVTVQQHWEDKLKLKLKFPRLPCIWVGSHYIITILLMCASQRVVIAFFAKKSRTENEMGRRATLLSIFHLDCFLNSG